MSDLHLLGKLVISALVNVTGLLCALLGLFVVQDGYTVWGFMLVFAGGAVLTFGNWLGSYLNIRWSRPEDSE